MRRSLARRDWDDEPLPGRGAQRIVSFPANAARRAWQADEQELDEPPFEPVFVPRQRSSQVAEAGESLTRYLVTAVALVLAVVAIAFLLLQLGQVGRQTPPSPKATQPAASQPTESRTEQVPASTVPSSPGPGTGPLRESRRIVEPSYTVAPGDTLGTIAARSGTSVDALQSINNLTDRNVLAVGQKLVLPNQR